MKNIRLSVFETNSSSTHSITVMGGANGIYDTLPVDDNGTVYLTGGEFGWGWEKFSDAITKANYAAVDVFSDPVKSQMLKEVIMEHTGAKEVIFNFTKNYDDDINDNQSYIDHQSVGTSFSAFKDKQTLKNFIFGVDSWLFTGNDNEDPPHDFYNIEFGKQYCFELKVEDALSSAKFEDIPNEEDLIKALYEIVYSPTKSKDSMSDYNIVKYDTKVLNKKEKINSLSKIKDNIIILYKLEHRYKGFEKYLGLELIDQIELKFHISEITNE